MENAEDELVSKNVEQQQDSVDDEAKKRDSKSTAAEDTVSTDEANDDRVSNRSFKSVLSTTETGARSIATGASTTSSNLEKSPSNWTLETDLNTALNDLKQSHLKEMAEIKVVFDLDSNQKSTISICNLEMSIENN